MIGVRLARREEWERVRELRLRALADAPDAFGSTFEHERGYDERQWLGWVEGWEGATNALFVAEEEGAWVGMAVGSRDDEEADAHLYGMWVDPALRGHGVGSSLVEAVAGWARSWGARWLVLRVTEGERGASGFYERLGFADTGERHPLREGSELVVRVLRRAP